MIEQIIYYLNKKIFCEEYFISNEEYKIFENVNINITEKNLEIIFNSNNLILSQTEINLIKNNILPFINEPTNIGTTSRVLSGCLCGYEKIIDEKIILECNKEIFHYYNIFIFRNLGIELLKKYNNISNYRGKKYILDINKDTNEYVYFDSNFQTYIVSNKEEYGYHLYWISDENKIDDKIILDFLQKKFPNSKFKINKSLSVTKLNFIPFKKNYVKIFHKVKECLDNFNIKVRMDILLSLD